MGICKIEQRSKARRDWNLKPSCVSKIARQELLQIDIVVDNDLVDMFASWKSSHCKSLASSNTAKGRKKNGNTA